MTKDKTRSVAGRARDWGCSGASARLGVQRGERETGGAERGERETGGAERGERETGGADGTCGSRVDTFVHITELYHVTCNA